MGLLNRIKNAPKRWSNRIKNRSFDGRDKLKVQPKVSKKPAEKGKKGKDKKKIDYRKWLRIGSALAQLGGGTDHAAKLAEEYDPTGSQGDKGYINPDEGKKKKKKNNGY